MTVRFEKAPISARRHMARGEELSIEIREVWKARFRGDQRDWLARVG
jgi:hypothetical protein